MPQQGEPEAPVAVSTRTRDGAAVLGVLALSTAVAVVALVTARGVVALGDDGYATEFIGDSWWLAFLLAPVPAVLARHRRATSVAAAAALVLPQFLAAAVTVARYRAAGWDDGLAVLSFLHPVLLTLLTGGLLLALGRRARAPHGSTRAAG